MQFAPYISSFLDIQRVEHEIWVVNQVDQISLSIRSIRLISDKYLCFSSILNSGGRLAVQQSCSDQCWLQGVESKL